MVENKIWERLEQDFGPKGKDEEVTGFLKGFCLQIREKGKNQSGFTSAHLEICIQKGRKDQLNKSFSREPKIAVRLLSSTKARL